MREIRRLLVFCALMGSAWLEGAPLHELRPGVFADTVRGTVFAARADGVLEAIDASTGTARWTSKDAVFPLAFDGRLLLARGESRGRTLPLLVLDTLRDGKVVAQRVAELPAQVDAAINDKAGRSFRAKGVRDRDGFRIDWTYYEVDLTGHSPQPGAAPPELRLSGTERIADPSFPLPRPPRCAARGERLKALHRLGTTPLRAGRVYATVTGGRGEPMFLKRWEACSGAPRPERLLLEKGLVWLPSADERHVMASTRVGKGGRSDPEYAWTVFGAEDGKRLATFRRGVSVAPFAIAGGLLVYISQPHGYLDAGRWIDVPLQVVAVQLSTDEVAWDRAIREIEFRGNLPPVAN